MTREQVLEVALRNMKTLFDGMGDEGRDMSSTVEFKCAELSPIYQQARAALALPPSKPETVNADMLAALQTAFPILTRLAELQRQERGGSGLLEGPTCNTTEYLAYCEVRAAIAKATS